MTTRRRCTRRFGSAISLSLVLCGLAGGVTFGQSTADPVSRLEGRYTGTLHTADQRFLRWPASGKDMDQKPGTKVELRVSLRSVGERWVLELRNTDDDVLPRPLRLSFAKSLAPVSAVELIGVAPQTWQAWAVRGGQSLTIMMVEINSKTSPVQAQLSLHDTNGRVGLTLRQVDQDGNRISSWGVALNRE